MKLFLRLFALTVVFVPNAVFAALIDRGGGLIYDDVQNITWLQNSNFGAGSAYDNGVSTSDGLMSWGNAVLWASNLNYYDSVRDVVWSDWRLPATPQPDATCGSQRNGVPPQGYGYNCTGSEMGYLNNVYGIKPNAPGPFTNLPTAPGLSNYWSATEYAPSSSLYAWEYYFYDGGPNSLAGGQQGWEGKVVGNFAWAVRGGDVAVVPAPATLPLLATGLCIGLARLRKRAA